MGALWGAALTCVVFLYLNRRNDRRVETHVGTQSGALRTPETRAEKVSAARPSTPKSPSTPSMFRLDAHHSGESAFVGPSSPEPAFTFKTGGAISAQPVQDADGNSYFGSHDHFFYCVGNDGKLRWKRDLGDRVYGTAFVDANGNSYVGSDADAIVSFDKTGTLRWKLLTEGDADSGILPTPDGHLVAAAGHHLWNFALDGTVNWRFEARGKIFSTPAVDTDGTIYVGSQDHMLYALAPDGRMRWAYATGGDVDSSPAIDARGNIYVGSDDKAIHSVARDGNARWVTKLNGYVRSAISIGSDGTVYAGTFGPTPELAALDADTGKERWHFAVAEVESPDVGIAASVLIDAQGFLYFGAVDDYLYALTHDGHLRWVFHTTGDVDSSPILSPNGQLFFGSDDGFLYALRQKP